MMTPRLSFPALRPKLIDRPAAALFLVQLSLFLSLVARAGGANIPEWLRSAAAESLPSYPAETNAVELLDDSQVIVKDSGDIEEHHREVYRILRPEGIERYSWVSVGYGPNSKISLFKAWTITPTGQEIEVSDKDVMEATLSTFEVYSDVKAKIAHFPSAAVGSIVAYEYIQNERPFNYDEEWDFQSTIPMHKIRLMLQLPVGWEFTSLWANMPELKPQSTGSNQYLWEGTDSPAVKIEPDMPPFDTIAAHVFLKFYPKDPALRAKAFDTWQDIGEWAWSLEEPMKVSTPSIQAKVAELTAGKTNTLDKMQALSEYVQRQIRYAAINIGIGGWQPHSAADVFSNQYGDCKDKATLFSAMLADIGIQSYDVTINTHRGVTDPRFPSNQFDHMILAIRLPDDVPDTILYSVVKNSKLGRLLLFDPTDEFVPLGYLPTSEQDSYGLAFGPDGVELLHTPTLPPATNRLLRTAKLTVGPTGNLIGEFHELSWGAPAQDERERFVEANASDRSKILETFLGHFLDNFELTNARIGNMDLYDRNLVLDYQVMVINYAKSAGDLLILHPRVLGEKSWDILNVKERKYPIEFRGTTRQDDIFDFTLPDGYTVDEIPDPVKAECPYGKYQSHVEVKGKTLEYTRTYEIDDIIVPTSKLPEVRDFFHEIAADERSSIVLKKIAQ